jgi:hypothetical protein
MMGNAMIQPTMYFNLRYVPMFSGPYMILSVDHTISQGSFETVLTGIRQTIYSLPQLDDYLQTLVKCYNTVNEHGIDTEHAHYQHIDKKYLIEFDKLHCEGIMAGTGATEVY